ncbi:MAG: hypothetical protein JOS17DRAFT_791437 [Linnemannia elongata]|nr:MAG: hypothetical protein JOS17DRAFT_791437 [Linnemannia elongata]
MVASAIHIDVEDDTTVNTRQERSRFLQPHSRTGQQDEESSSVRYNSFQRRAVQLEIRVNELNTVVDSFVIIESNQAFSRVPKPLYYLINKDRFRDFHSKIIHIFGPVVFRYWSQDYNVILLLLLYTRRYQALEANAARQEKAIQRMYKNMKAPEVKTEFQGVIDHTNRTRDEASLYHEAWKKNWQDGGFRIRWLRARKEIALLNDTCWHCTYCQSNTSQIIYKLQSSSHL